MSTPVNYYHYSVYKLLVVNLTSSLKIAASPKKNFRLRPGWRLAIRPASTANPGKRSRFCRLAHCLKKFSDSGKAANLANTTASTPPQALSVDKPMNIHRIECAKPRGLATDVFLSSFGPRQTQALFSSLERT
jgi:hypothetical protein